VHYTDRRADRGVGDIAAGLRRHLAEHGVADAEVSAIEPGIEDVFMALMQRTSRPAA
jgi:hypothetical protein